MRMSRLITVLAGLTAITLLAADASAYYHPSMGRFMQRDPGPAASPARIGTAGYAAFSGFTPRDPVAGQYADGMSLYQYVGSLPLTHVDPTGLLYHPNSGLAWDLGDGKIIPVASAPQCCGGRVLLPHEGCCDGKVYKLATECCCGKKIRKDRQRLQQQTYAFWSQVQKARGQNPGPGGAPWGYEDYFHMSKDAMGNWDWNWQCNSQAGALISILYENKFEYPSYNFVEIGRYTWWRHYAVKVTPPCQEYGGDCPGGSPPFILDPLNGQWDGSETADNFLDWAFDL